MWHANHRSVREQWQVQLSATYMIDHDVEDREEWLPGSQWLEDIKNPQTLSHRLYRLNCRHHDTLVPTLNFFHTLAKPGRRGRWWWWSVGKNNYDLAINMMIMILSSQETWKKMMMMMMMMTMMIRDKDDDDDDDYKVKKIWWSGCEYDDYLVINMIIMIP